MAMDIDCGQVYCFECGDYKYDIDFIKIAEELSAIARRRKSAYKSQVKPIIGKLDKWEPSPELIDILQYHKKDIVYNNETGIRGLVNISSFTCYLNVIFQCLIHAPVFRDYLLSLQHKCKSDSKKDLCLICQITNAVQESFSGEKKPLALSKILSAFFYRCQHYAQAEFQDAHDCFKDLIVNLHEDEIGEVKLRNNSISLEMLPSCTCIIHEIFGFKIQRQEICDHCKQVTVPETVAASFISLNQLEPPESTDETATLTECLQRTWKEMVICSACKASAGCTLQSKPTSLPYILNILSNQFDHKKDQSAFLKWEETLDLSPFILPSWKTERDSLPEHAYYLFAFVEYDRGHYRCYIKKGGDKWFKCDDKETCPISMEDILEINVRLLFYHKMFM